PRVRARPASTLFPYTTLFRSGEDTQAKVGAVAVDLVHVERAHEAEDLAADHLARNEDREPRRIGNDERGRNDRATLVDLPLDRADRKSTRLNSSHVKISYAVF